MAQRSSNLNHLAGLLLLLGGAAPAGAESFTYQGELQLQSASRKDCSALADASYPIVVYGRDDGPQRIEGYLYGEKIVHAHFIGNSLNQLTLTFPGGAAQPSTLRLRSSGEGSFTGELPAYSMVAALGGCGPVPAQIRFARVAVHTQADFERAAQLYQWDDRSMQLYLQGMKGAVREAVAGLQEALAKEQKLYAPRGPELLPYLFFLGQLQQAAGNVADSVNRYRAALETCEQSFGTDSACSGLTLIYLGGALVDDGAYAEAGAIQQRTLEICNRLFGADAPVCGRALNAVAAVQIYTGRYADAETTLNQALSLNRKDTPGDNGNVGISLNNLAVLYRYTGRYAKAEAAQRQALAVDTKALGPEAPLTILNTVVLAQILRLLNQSAAAEPLARSALAAAQKVLGPERPDHPALSVALLGLAEILCDTGRYSEAEPLYRRALANSTRYLGAEHPDVATISTLLAELLLATGRDAEGLSLLKQAYAIAQHSDSPELAWRVPGALMKAYASGPTANRALAIFYGKEAVNDLQLIRGNLSASTSETQRAFVSSAEVSAIYHQLITLLVADDRASEAQQVMAMVKEQEFYAFTDRTSDTAAPVTVSTLNSTEKQLDALASKDVALGREYAALQAKFKHQELSVSDRTRLGELRGAMDKAQADFQAHAAAVAASAVDPETRRRRQHEIDDFSRAFQGTLRDLGHGAVMAQYFIQNDRVTIFLTTPNSFIAREAPITRAQLNERIRAFRSALSAPNQDPRPLAAQLYQLLIGPIAADLHEADAKTLMLSLDDTLRYLPFAALYDGRNYLVENMAIAMVNEAVRDKLTKPPNANWTVWGLGITKGGKDYEALPYAAVELNGIAGSHGILGGKVLLDGAFTESALRDGLDQSYPIVHIASHFQFTPGSMDDSFLLLGDGSHMTLAQMRLRLNFSNVELLTLSACETALGDDSSSYHGVEVEGLGALAQDAGARSVLATLWPVADASTAALMRALYEAHSNDHADKAEALRSAQLALIHGTVKVGAQPLAARGLARMGSTPSAAPVTFTPDPAAPFAHPFYWAPFILMGNWL